jgi:hypothetical protein
MAIIEYPTSEPVRSARARYFEANHFGADGGYGDAWVEVKFGPIPVPIPNTEARVRAVRYHDLHHIVTGYDTDLVGEMEISAWELGAGCEDFVAAYILNVGGLSGGAAIAPRRTLRAFARGRREPLAVPPAGRRGAARRGRGRPPRAHPRALRARAGPPERRGAVPRHRHARPVHVGRGVGARPAARAAAGAVSVTREGTAGRGQRRDLGAARRVT